MMSYLGQCNKTGTVQRNTPSRDSRGRVTASWANSTTNVQCGLYAMTASEIMADQGLGIDADYKILLPPGTDVRPRPSSSSTTAQYDRIVIGSVNYLVASVEDPTGKGRALVAHCKRMV